MGDFLHECEILLWKKMEIIATIVQDWRNGSINYLFKHFKNSSSFAWRVYSIELRTEQDAILSLVILLGLVVKPTIVVIRSATTNIPSIQGT